MEVNMTKARLMHIIVTLLVGATSAVAGGVVYKTVIEEKPVPQEVVLETITSNYGFSTDGDTDIDIEVSFEGIKDTETKYDFSLDSNSNTAVVEDIDMSMLSADTPVVATIKLTHNYQYENVKVEFTELGEIKDGNIQKTLNGAPITNNRHIMQSVSKGGNQAEYKFTISAKDAAKIATGTAGALFNISKLEYELNGGLVFATDGEANIEAEVSFTGIKNSSVGYLFELDSTNKIFVLDDFDVSMIDVNTPIETRIKITNKQQYEKVKVNFETYGEIDNASIGGTLNGEELDLIEHDIPSSNAGSNYAEYIFTISSDDMISFVTGKAGLIFDIVNIPERIMGNVTFIAEGMAELDGVISVEGSRIASQNISFSLDNFNSVVAIDNIDVSMTAVDAPVTINIDLEHEYEFRSLNVHFTPVGELENADIVAKVNGEEMVSENYVMTSVDQGGNQVRYQMIISSHDLINMAKGSAGAVFDISFIEGSLKGGLEFNTDGDADVDVAVSISGVNNAYMLPEFSLDSTNTSKTFSNLDVSMVDVNSPVVISVNIKNNKLYEGVNVSLSTTNNLNNADISAKLNGTSLMSFSNVIADAYIGYPEANYEFTISSQDLVSLATGEAGLAFDISQRDTEIEYDLGPGGIGIYENALGLPITIGLATDDDYTLPTQLSVVGPTEQNKNDVYSDKEMAGVRSLIDAYGIENLGIYDLNGVINIPMILALQNEQIGVAPCYKNQLAVNIADDSSSIAQALRYSLIYALASLNQTGNSKVPIVSAVYMEIFAAYTLACLQGAMEEYDLTEDMIYAEHPEMQAYFDPLGGLPVPGTQAEEKFYLAVTSIAEYFEFAWAIVQELSNLKIVPETIYIKQFNIVPGTEYNISEFAASVPSFGIGSIMRAKNVIINSDIDYMIESAPLVATNNYVINENPLYSTLNGELFNAEKTILIAYNFLKSNVQYAVPESVTTIAEAVFWVEAINEIFATDLESVIINYNQINNVPNLKDSGIDTILRTDKYVSRNQIATWLSNEVMNCRIEYIDDHTGLTYVYDEGKEGYMVQSFESDTQTFISIPATYCPTDGEEFEVVGIKKDAFALATALTNIYIPDTIRYIEDSAFAGATNVKEIDFGRAGLIECGTNIFGNRHDIIAHSQIEATAKKLKATADNATSIKMKFDIETARSTTERRESMHMGTFNVTFTIDGHEFTLDTQYTNTISTLFNSYMVVYKDSSAEIDVSVAVSINAEPTESQGKVDHIQEQVAIGKIAEDGTVTMIAGTPNDVTYYNHSGNQASVSYSGKANTGDNLQLIVNFVVMTQVQCFTEGTLVTLADGSTKPIEDVTYDDLLLVYDFDRGEFGYSYPIWIATPGQYDNYYLMKFDDGSEVEIVLSHRLFNTQDLSFEKSVDALYTQVGQPFFKQSVDGGGNLVITTPKCVSIEKINKTCTYYNMVTSQALNFFANGFLGSTGISNIYTFEKLANGHYIHNQEQLANTRGTDTIQADLFEYEDFDTSKITYEMYIAYRLGEAKNMAKVLSIVPPYSNYPIETVYQVAIKTINDYFDEDYAETRVQWPETFKVTTSEGVSTRVNPKAAYTLSAPTDSTGFVGWYNTFDGKVYSVGDEVTIYMNTHFIARYN